MSRTSPLFVAYFSLAAVFVLPGCEQKPEVVTEAVGSSVRGDPWSDGPTFAPTPTGTATSPALGGTEFGAGTELGAGGGIGGDAWKFATPKLDFGSAAPPQATSSGTAANPFIGIEFKPGTGDVKVSEEFGTVADILARMEQADQRAPTIEYERMWVQARDLVAKNQFDQALTLFEKMRQLKPKDTRAQVGEGIVYLHRKDLKRAVAVFEIAVRTDPTMLETYHFLAQAHLALDNQTAALADYAALLRQSPDNIEALLNRLNLLFQQRQYNELIVDAETLIRLRPNMPDGFLYRGVAYLMKQRQAEAQRDFEESVRLGLAKETEKILRPRFFPVVP